MTAMTIGDTLSRIVTSLFSTVVRALADGVAAHPGVPPENREALRDTARSVIAAELQRMFGGEQLRMYVPRLSAEQRQERDARVADADGPADDVANRERLSDRQVRRIRGRIGGGHGF